MTVEGDLDGLGRGNIEKVDQRMAQQDAESSTSEDEAACFEDDTESFMQRKREFLLPNLPPGERGKHQRSHTRFASVVDERD